MGLDIFDIEISCLMRDVDELAKDVLLSIHSHN